MSLPVSINFNGREVPLYQYGQLFQQPRSKLKGRAMDLRDMVGADKLPPLRTTGSIESVTVWILEVQCLLASSAGVHGLTPQMLGMPADYGAEEEQNLLNHGSNMGKSAAARQPMAEIPVGPDAAAQAAHESAMQAAQATAMKNRMGASIFG